MRVALALFLILGLIVSGSIALGDQLAESEKRAATLLQSGDLPAAMSKVVQAQSNRSPNAPFEPKEQKAFQAKTWQHSQDIESSRESFRATLQMNQGDPSAQKALYLSGLEDSNSDKNYIALEAIDENGVRDEKILQSVENAMKAPIRAPASGSAFKAAEVSYDSYVTLEKSLNILYKAKSLTPEKFDEIFSIHKDDENAVRVLNKYKPRKIAIPIDETSPPQQVGEP